MKLRPKAMDIKRTGLTFCPLYITSLALALDTGLFLLAVLATALPLLNDLYAI